MTEDLFSRAVANDRSLTPLADRMRPRELSEFVGQTHLLGEGRFLERAIAADRVPSLVLWGPPGTGKTTLARVIANRTGTRFVPFSAVSGSVKEVREIVAEAAEQRRAYRRRTILFIDEIHRFNKAQQDVLLPCVEQGVVTLIGATTENPSFSVIAALLSRCKVLTLEPLAPEEIRSILERALADADKGLGASGVTVEERALEFIAEAARGDARYALSALEIAVQHALGGASKRVDLACIEEAAQAKALLYDKAGEEHYNVVSAFIKSLRGSDPDAALYWMFRMIEAGEDPLFVLRRMIIFASEDVGNADPHALQVVVAADSAYQRVGMPEGAYPLAQACTYLACAQKSNAQVDAIALPRRDIAEHGPLPVPAKLRNAPTKLMKEMGYGASYRYPHAEGGYARGETYLPDALVGRRYYVPKESGVEAKIAARLRWLRGEDDGGDRNDG
ncbi:MAG: replication-associated recombination protein A [Proteobacteria bacterium]|jgi:putative ATPase|nr:replication-associated recombination protein A [Pseudomonadota bacterium]